MLLEERAFLNPAEFNEKESSAQSATIGRYWLEDGDHCRRQIYRLRRCSRNRTEM